MKKLLYLFICFVFASHLFAQKGLPDPYIIKPDNGTYTTLPFKNWQFWASKDSVDIKAATSPVNTAKFIKGTDDTKFSGNRYVWVRFKLKNKLNAPQKITLKINADRTTIYILQNSTTKQFTTGYYVPKSKKDGIKELLQIPVTVGANQEITVYQQSLVKKDIDDLWPEIGNYEKVIDTEFFSKTSYTGYSLLEAGLFGFILFAAIFNFFFVVITRERVYLIYFITLLLSAVSYGADVIASVLFIENPQEVSLFKTILSVLLLFMILQTLRAFIQVKHIYPKWNKFLVWYPLFLIITTSVTLLPVGEMATGVAIVISILSIMFFLIGNIIVLSKLLIRKDKQAKLFIIAGIPFLICMLLSVFNNLDDLKAVGGIWAIIVLSWAMFARFRLLMHENANQALLREEERNRIIAQQNEILELQVAERTAELQHSLENLTQTQNQLIQSEKMASLGELTAGIAHEIQNPLNFVNNFSDVSIELLDEMQEEMAKGDTEEATAIAADIKLNLEKIAHHGRRADGIVKGMLQHSRASSGQKEPVDINTLADEYFRLAYHGLRAKDKSFNADLLTHFGESLPKVNIVPQDIGRVLLNLFTNAFYATQEKSRQWAVNSDQSQLTGSVYKPQVEVITIQKDKCVQIIVKDNGTGIPNAIKDKILQPFFTTKPTGEGTGLGLSLSYDIVVKAHGGSIDIESTEGEGSEFKITLPVA